MNTLRILAPLLALGLLPAAALAQEGACTLPGELLLEDPSGDQGVLTPAGAVVPLPVDAADIQSLHVGQQTGRLVFTLKVASLSQTVPQTAHIIRFATDVPPADGNEDYFVAMLTGPDATRFVYGTDGFALGLPAAEPRQFTIAGELDAASNFAADGTITLVLDRAAVPGIEPGLAVYNILPTVRAVTPADGPFFTNADNATILDDTPGSGFYDVVACDGDEAKLYGSGGALPLLTLVALLPAALRRRRR